MAFDYDLVIIGGSAVARYAAARASTLKARVALVEAVPLEHSQERANLYHYALTEAGQWLRQMQAMQNWGFFREGLNVTPAIASPENASLRRNALKWAATITEAVATNEWVGYSLPRLAASGVDVVLGQGTFWADARKGKAISQPRDRHLPVFHLNGRDLRSRTYLLAPSSFSAIPPIEGLDTVDYRAIDSLWRHPWQTLPHRLLILGGTPRSIELAQILNRLGCEITLAVSGQLLSQEDPETIALLQAQLEAEGVTILTQAKVTQARQLNQTTWVQAGDRALEVDALLLETGQYLDLQPLNLESVGTKWHPRRVLVNPKLQTTNPRIYACGEALGGYPLPHLAQYEADIALHNALFFPTSKVDYQPIPWTILTTPAFARVGLTEAQAKQLYGDKIVVLRQSFKPLVKPHLQGETTGLCKLIVSRTGKILGAHMVGAEASEWVGAIALAMKHRVRLGNIAQSAFVTPSFSEVISQLVMQWRQHLPTWQRDWLESWFNWRRS